MRSMVHRPGVVWTGILQNTTPPGPACRYTLTCHLLSLSNSWMQGLAVPCKLQVYCLRWGWKTTAMYVSAQLPWGRYAMWTWVIFMSTTFFVYNIISITPAQTASALLNQISPSNCSWVHIAKQSHAHRIDFFWKKLNPKLCFRRTSVQSLTNFSLGNQTKASKTPWNTQCGFWVTRAFKSTPIASLYLLKFSLIVCFHKNQQEQPRAYVTEYLSCGSSASSLSMNSTEK